MAAQRITAIKNINPDGSILEIVIWKVPKPVPPTEHGYKYRAVYVVDGVRIVGFDNERGKGDHCHMDGKELPYTFTSVDQLGKTSLKPLKQGEHRDSETPDHYFAA